MCKFFSCIVTKDKDVLWDSSTNSHEDLIRLYNIKDQEEIVDRRKFVRIEALPPKWKDFANTKKWEIKVDESETPSWYKEGYEKVIQRAIALRVKYLLLKPAYGKLSNLCEANLCGANLIEANLCGADLCGQDIEDLKSRGAIL